VAVATAPGPRRSLLGALLTTVLAVVRPRSRPRRLAELVSAARQHVVTVAALAAMDLGAFQVWHHGGWFAIGLSVLLLDFAVTG
jgi:hypothetical protein